MNRHELAQHNRAYRRRRDKVWPRNSAFPYCRRPEVRIVRGAGRRRATFRGPSPLAAGLVAAQHVASQIRALRATMGLGAATRNYFMGGSAKQAGRATSPDARDGSRPPSKGSFLAKSAILLLCLAGLARGYENTPPAASPLAQPTNTVDPAAASFRVAVPKGQGITDYGSATAIGDRWLVTNSHVVDHRQVQQLVVTDGRRAWPGRCIGVDPAADLALLEIDTSEALPAVHLAEQTPQPGQTLGIRGYGEKGVPQWKQAKVDDGTFHRAGGVPQLVMQAFTEKGDSGAGAFNAEGELVAVVWGSDEGFCAATPVRYVRELCCRGGRCILPMRRPPQQMQPPRPVQQQPVAQQLPAPTVAPPRPPAAVCQCDTTGLQAAIAVQQQRLEQLAAQVNRLQAQPGPPGPQGPAGPEGPPGQVATIDYDLLAVRIAAQIRPEPASPVNMDQLAAEVVKRLPPTPAYFEIKPRSQR